MKRDYVSALAHSSFLLIAELDGALPAPDVVWRLLAAEHLLSGPLPRILRRRSRFCALFISNQAGYLVPSEACFLCHFRASLDSSPAEDECNCEILPFWTLRQWHLLTSMREWKSLQLSFLPLQLQLMWFCSSVPALGFDTGANINSVFERSRIFQNCWSHESKSPQPPQEKAFYTLLFIKLSAELKLYLLGTFKFSERSALSLCVPVRSPLQCRII